MENRKIVVIGSYIVALVMEAERLPLKGETLKAKNYHKAYGGKGSNQAVQASRLGANVSFVSKIGHDNTGDDFIELCKQEGISSEYVYRHDSLPTATGFIICSSDGYNIITIDLGALNEFLEEDIDKVLKTINKDDIVLIQLEEPLQTAFYAARHAKEKGAVVILNPAPAHDLSAMDLSVVDYLTPNETEAKVCLGLPSNLEIDEEDMAKQLFERGCKNVIITLGEKGCLYYNGKNVGMFSACHIHDVVDSTGAGDAFNAALAVALYESKGIYEAITFANATAALSCTKFDTIPSFHKRKEVDLYLESLQKG